LSGFLAKLSGQGATISAALIGAVIGTLGSVLLTDWLAAERQSEAEKMELIQNHLTQLQESSEQLWYRIAHANLKQAKERGPDYHVASVLYALGRYVATDRRVAREGLLPEIRSTAGCSELAEILNQKEYGDLLVKIGVPYYDRLALVGFITRNANLQDPILDFYEFRLKLDGLSDTQRQRYFQKNIAFAENLANEIIDAKMREPLLDNLCRTINSVRSCIGDNALSREIKTTNMICSKQ
jgi:hypothetical protein